jgi:hypothetical protein
LAGSTYEFSGDEHGRIKLAANCGTPPLGERIELVASHCDPTVAHYDVYHCVRGNTIVAVWAIDARGRRGPLPLNESPPAQNRDAQPSDLDQLA